MISLSSYMTSPNTFFFLFLLSVILKEFGALASIFASCEMVPSRGAVMQWCPL